MVVSKLKNIEYLTNIDVNRINLKRLLLIMSQIEDNSFFNCFKRNCFFLESGKEFYTNESKDNDNVKFLPFCYLKGPVLILEGTTIGPHAYIRPFTIIGKNCKIGHSVEIKSSLICNNVSIAHRAYIGNSIIGKESMIGVGVSTAVRNDDSSHIILRDISANLLEQNTGLFKMGIILGQKSWIDSHVITMPGTFIEENSKLRPFNSYGGSCGKKI